MRKIEEQKNVRRQNNRVNGHAQRLVLAAFLAALSIVCGKYLAIPIGTVLRFSLENLPILLAGMVLGPVAGVLTGVVADLVGCVLVGYAINPIITLGGATVGLVGGLIFRALSRCALSLRILLAVLAAHLLGSVLIKTWGLAVFYDMPFYVLLLWRLLNYVIVGTVESLLLLYLLKNKTVRSSLERLR